MKRLITTLKNIWSIDELKGRILFTIAMLAIYRIGSFIILPGVNRGALENSISNSPDSLLGIINMFSGGAFKNASLFALGIMPYITASIIIQLLGFAVPYFQRLQQKEGESGRKKITQITRMLTVFICLVQGTGYLSMIQQTPNAINPAVPTGIFWLSNIIILCAGTIFAMWLGEKITDKGIGNGVSLLITIGIIATLPAAFIGEMTKQSNPFMFLIVLAALFAVTLATVLIVQGVRKIPIQFAKRIVGRGNNEMPVAGNRDYIPVKVNAAGVMPIIFAQALMFLPGTVATYFMSGDGGAPAAGSMAAIFNDITSGPYNIVYFFLVVVFTYVYTALLVNPQQYSEYLKRQNAFIPGVKPGKSTADFIDNVTTRITLPGSIFLGLISILPAIVNKVLGVNLSLALFFGGTSMLILVAVVLDTLQQIESYLLMRKYDGLVKSGKLQGRSRMQGIGAGM